MSMLFRTRLLAAVAFLVSGSAALWHHTITAPVTATETETSLEQKAHLILEDVLGKGRFQVYLDRQTRSVVRMVTKSEIGDSKVSSEQIKDEEMGPGAEKGPYKYHIASRQYAVGETESREVVSGTEVTRIRCVVSVDADAWERTDTARAALQSLLGLESERGDELTFVRRT